MLSLEKLKNIDTPARYIGTEARQVVKNVANIKSRICTIVPMMYEIASFDMDLKAIYYTLNSRRTSWCERCFAPMPDFEMLLKINDEQIFTLESKTPLKQMDALLFILSSEMTYTNMLNILNLGKVPCIKNRRKEGFPLVIATGEAILNPCPTKEFVDIYIIGEASLVITEIVEKIEEAKEKNLTKEETLESMKNISGVYIPDITTKDVHMVIEENLDHEQIPRYLVKPSIATMFDDTMVTLSRGCSRNCMMCTHKYAYGTPKYMSIDKATLKTHKLINATGDRCVRFMTNCYGDFPNFNELIYKVQELERPSVNKISFMEVKFNKDNLWLLKYMTDFSEIPSIIVGGATSKLREKVGIEIDEEEVYFVARKLFEAGYTKVRLKFIIGIPGENYEDFTKILDIANKVCKIYKEVYVKAPDKFIVELNIYNFVAKPHTPSQYAVVNTAENFEIKTRYLIDRNKNENVVITADEGKQSVISCMLARGDEKVSKVIYEAFKLGARHDYMPGLFNIENWQVALNKCKIELKEYLEEKNEKVLLPWDNIYLNTPKEELRRIYVNKIRSIK